ncbi:MAG: hypothetical protein ABFS02_07440 [Pseudomonadota bacterium]
MSGTRGKLEALEGGRDRLLDEAWGNFLHYLETDDQEAGDKFDELVRRVSRKSPRLAVVGKEPA